MDRMQLLLKDTPIMEISEDGGCEVLAPALLPYGLRWERVTFADVMEWAAGRTIPMGRSFAKEILGALRLSQVNRFAVCKACRGLSLTDSYWLRQEGDTKTWDEVSLFRNPFMLYVAEVSMSGRILSEYARRMQLKEMQESIRQRIPRIHTPEVTTQGASAKAWIHGGDGLFLHKVGKYEIPAHQILTALHFPHISYCRSGENEISAYLAPERRQWLDSIGEAVVKSRIFTSEDTAYVTFEEFRIYCDAQGLDPWREAMKLDREAYLRMQVADYILNNPDRHGQNWGFLMNNATGRLEGFCSLFDHDRAFSGDGRVLSQTTELPATLEEAAAGAWEQLCAEDEGVGAEYRRNFAALKEAEKPADLSVEQWEQVLERVRQLVGE